MVEKVELSNEEQLFKKVKEVAQIADSLFVLKTTKGISLEGDEWKIAYNRLVDAQKLLESCKEKTLEVNKDSGGEVASIL